MDTLLIYILMLIIPAIASLNIRIVYSKYAKINGKSDLTGFDVAKKILEKNGLDELYIVETQGYLTDAYDSSRKTVRLSSDIYHGTSISSIAVSAHECGHAIQDKEGYPWMRFRTMIFPVVSLGEKLAYIDRKSTRLNSSHQIISYAVL